jgi:hypothetical protein
MHTLETAMAAAVLDRSQPCPRGLYDGARQGIRSLARLALGVAAIAMFCLTMEVATNAFALDGVAKVAVQSPR